MRKVMSITTKRSAAATIMRRVMSITTKRSAAVIIMTTNVGVTMTIMVITMRMKCLPAGERNPLPNIRWKKLKIS
jgi:hypothetical protein